MNCKSLIASGFVLMTLAASAAAQTCQTDRLKDLVCGDGRDQAHAGQNEAAADVRAH